MLSASSFANCFDVRPSSLSIEPKLKLKIEKLIQNTIDSTNLTSLSILIGTSSKSVYAKAFGYVSKTKPNSLDMIYDLASITKVFTASALLKELESKDIDISTKMNKLLDPKNTNSLKDKISIEDLLRHESGFKSGLLNREFGQNTEESWNNIVNLIPTKKYKRFLYSDINYLLLGKILEKVSSETLHKSIERLLLKPLNLENTYFAPKGVLCGDCAPTSKGQVVMKTHDPTAHKLGGGVGSAGIFSNLYDLGKFASIFLNKGKFCGKRILSSKQVREMTLKKHNSSRGLGFDISSAYSNRPRGDYFNLNKSFGHTGYTGTSLWIDPVFDVFVVVLTNSVINPKAKKIFLDLNKSISTLIGKSFSNNKSF